MSITDQYETMAMQAKQAVVVETVRANLGCTVEELIEAFEALADEEAVELFRKTPLTDLLPGADAIQRSKPAKSTNGVPKKTRAAKSPRAPKSPPPRLHDAEGVVKQVHDFVRKNPESSKSAIMAGAEASEVQFRQAVLILTEQGKLKRQGQGRGTKYVAV